MTDQTRTGGDTARQIANVAGAVLQLAAGPLSFLVGLNIGEVANEYRSLILPAGYAFAIWTPIYLLSLVYAVYQALPKQRESHLLRRIGWLTAGAYFGNAVWTFVFPSRQYVLAQVLIFGIWLLLAVAFARWLAVAQAGTTTTGERWLAALPLGLLFGWLTAANVAGLAATLIAQGLAADGIGAAVGGAALLVFGGTVAATVITLGKRGPVSGWGAYAAAVLWALVAIAVNQYDASLLTTATAVGVAIILLGVAFFVPALAGTARGWTVLPTTPRPA